MYWTAGSDHVCRGTCAVLLAFSMLLGACATDTARGAKDAPQPVAQAVSQSFADPATGMEFVVVKGKCFDMGDTFGDGGPAEQPVHTVCVGSFTMGKHEVTVGQFTAFANATGYTTDAERGDGCYGLTRLGLKKDKEKNWRNPGFNQTAKHPVVCVSWNDAKAFIDWMSATSGTPYRLPTEAEWEYAARSGGKAHQYAWGRGKPSGNIADSSLAGRFAGRETWEGYDDSTVYTAAIGSFKPNELGLYDMTGNVWEWMSDWYDEAYYRASPKENPAGPSSGELRSIRGGGWLSKPGDLRLTKRFGMSPSTSVDNMGFRVAGPPR